MDVVGLLSKTRRRLSSPTNALRTVFRKLGFDVVRYKGPKHPEFPPDFETQQKEIIQTVKLRTITSNECLYALMDSVRHIVRNRIAGGFVECGVYKGGSVMAMALSLMMEGVMDRDLYLFDTFTGMPKPGEDDVDFRGDRAIDKFFRTRLSDVSSTWANESIESVKTAMEMTGYTREKVHFVQGLVEDTIPGSAPDPIALLRLDTDFYGSTLHELNHLYPRVSLGGIVIIDDYGHYEGARKAVDEYFSAQKAAPLLHRLDYTARLIVKRCPLPNEPPRPTP